MSWRHRGNHLRAWYKRQIDEIAGDRALRFYGVALGYVSALAFVHWAASRGAARIVSDTYQPICWPFWENCAAWRVLSAEAVQGILWGGVAVSIVAGLCFLAKRGVAWGWWLLLAANVLRIVILAQDFQLRLNQHYMANWVALAFLFFPARRVLVPALLVSFYFWAGVLKLDWEWLSGVGLYHRERLWMPDSLVPASCVYVVVLEMALIFGLYSRRAWLFWLTVGQLVLFHLYSWPIVGFYYPMLMFGLDSILVFAWLFADEHRIDWRPLLAARVRLPATLLLAGFAFTQLLPKAFPGDEAITGEGRLFALNMFDARVVCEGWAVLHFDDSKDRKSSFSNRSYATRIACDPILYFDLARNECRRARRGPALVDLDLHLRSRRSTEQNLRDVIDIPSFCTSDVTYDLWRPNDWIRKDSPAAGS